MNTLSLFLEMCKNTLTLSQFTQIPSESNDSSVKQDDVTLFFLCLLLVTIPFMTTQQLLMRMFTEEYSLNIKVFIYNLIVYILLIIVHSIFMNILNKFCNRMAQKKISGKKDQEQEEKNKERKHRKDKDIDSKEDDFETKSVDTTTTSKSISTSISTSKSISTGKSSSSSKSTQLSDSTTKNSSNPTINPFKFIPILSFSFFPFVKFITELIIFPTGICEFLCSSLSSFLILSNLNSPEIFVGILVSLTQIGTIFITKMIYEYTNKNQLITDMITHRMTQ